MISLKKTDALYQQIANYFEREIVEGRLSPGDRIPATTELARQFQVNADTIQQSLKLLMSRGLIDRKPGRGTYIRRGVNSKTVGIVFGKEIYTNPDVMFFSTFLDSIINFFSKNGWDTKLFSTSEFADYDKAFYDIKSMVESGEIRAMVEFCSNDLIRNWLDEECPVPVSSNYLDVDFHDMTLKGLEYMFFQGARNIVVQSYCPEETDEYRRAVDEFQKTVDSTDLQVHLLECGSHAKEGYDCIKNIWARGMTPDGLITANDSAFRGSLYALLELGIKIPDEIKLITYANKGLDIFCHVPLTKLEVDPDAFAKRTYEKIIAKIDGKKSNFNPVKARLVPGLSCGEKQ